LQALEEKKMKLLLTLTGLFTAAFLLVAADAPGVVFVSHDKVATALAKSGPIVTAPDLLISGSFRDKAGEVEVHDVQTDTIYVIDGTATFVTGGTIVGDKVRTPGQHFGTDIKGGQTHHLTKGDVIVVPAGVPHWFKEVPKTVSYYVVKVIKK